MQAIVFIYHRVLLNRFLSMATDTSSLCHRTKHHKHHLLFLIFLPHVLCWQAYQKYNWEPPFSVNNMAAVSFYSVQNTAKRTYSKEHTCNYTCKHIFGGNNDLCKPPYFEDLAIENKLDNCRLSFFW